MIAVFVDSCFWIALRDERDAFHSTAKGIVVRLMRLQQRLICTPFIFAETHARFSRSAILRARIIRDFWDNPVVQMENPTGADQRAAIDILREQTDKSYSFCDALSFAIMIRMGLREVVTFDDHFRQFGKFEVVDQ